jgi:2-keto-3-deoxy-galactonokinase
VLGNLPREQVSEFLSGLLIGAEVASMAEYVIDHQVTIVAGKHCPAAINRRWRQLAAKLWSFLATPHFRQE